ncbi:MAG: sulfite exporter TauE/SafE family protein [Oscillospiraceae bacterium]
MDIVYLIISFVASCAGAICGIGGGVIIKPVLDAVGIASVATINFLSGCTVLAMSAYSVGKGIMSKEKAVDFSTGTPLAIGAAVGGIIGKNLFSAVASLFNTANTAGAVQAACLLVITVGTLIYTINKDKVKTHKITSPVACIIIGLALGIMSSFLGIGGGPINLVVLYYFFSMPTKTAAQNSLYIILFSQLTGFLSTVVSGVPTFSPLSLALMVAGGILGAICGRSVNKKLTGKGVDKLFMGLMLVIISLCAYNIAANLIRY